MSKSKRKPIAELDSTASVLTLSPGDIVERGGVTYRYIDIVNGPAFREIRNGRLVDEYTYLTGDVRVVRSPNSERRSGVKEDETDPLLAGR